MTVGEGEVSRPEERDVRWLVTVTGDLRRNSLLCEAAACQGFKISIERAILSLHSAEESALHVLVWASVSGY